MGRFNNPLDHVRIAAPCKADWQQMIGTDKVRFCGQCNLNVFNLSSMTKTEAESLIARTEGRLCARFYRRSDGSILTKNCPVGLRAIRKRLSYLAKASSAAVLSFLAGLGVYRTFAAPTEALMGVIAISTEPLTMPQTGMLLEMGEMPSTTYQVQEPIALSEAELGQAFIEHDQNLAGRKPRRHTGRLRMAPTR